MNGGYVFGLLAWIRVSKVDLLTLFEVFWPFGVFYYNWQVSLSVSTTQSSLLTKLAVYIVFFCFTLLCSTTTLRGSPLSHVSTALHMLQILSSAGAWWSGQPNSRTWEWAIIERGFIFQIHSNREDNIKYVDGFGICTLWFNFVKSFFFSLRLSTWNQEESILKHVI